jgi:hypothetical protein
VAGARLVASVSAAFNAPSCACPGVSAVPSPVPNLRERSRNHADPHFGNIGCCKLLATELSEMAAVSVATVKRIEAATAIRGSAEAVWKIQKALESAGIEFGW